MYTADGKIKRRSLQSGQATRIEFSVTLTVRPASYTRKRRDFDSTTPQPAKGIIRPVVSRDGAQLAFAALGDLWTMPIAAARATGTATGQATIGRPTRLTDDRFVDTVRHGRRMERGSPSRRIGRGAWTSGFAS